MDKKQIEHFCKGCNSMQEESGNQGTCLNCGRKLSKNNHTSGPWTYEKEPNGLTFSIWNEDLEIAETQTEGDATLIAAAPELLAALRKLYAVIKDKPAIILSDDEISMGLIAKDAIAKAGVE